MNRNLAQPVDQGEDGRWRILYDWYPIPLPENILIEDNVYLDSAYSFACFHSKLSDGFKMGFASGNYLRSHFYAGERGRISIGKYVILETTHILANDSVTIGDHCMASWGSVVTDSWLNESTFHPSVRKKILEEIAGTETRFLKIPFPKSVVIEDNVWIGFDAVILPGVRLGHGCVVGCKTVITEDVPPYAVVVGNPSRIVKYLDGDDTEEKRMNAL